LPDSLKEVAVLERLVVADDLSGAAESAATFLLRTTRIRVHLMPGGADASEPLAATPRVVVLDTDTRHLGPDAAGQTVARYAAQALGAARSTRVVKKVDSLLRGNLATEVGSLATQLRATAVIATALPSAGRTVVDGVPAVDGVPLADTNLWSAEPGPAPETVGAVLTGLQHVTVPLDVVREPARLRAALRAAERHGAAAVCDAETDADLDAVVAAAAALRNPLLVGSSALVAADARQLRADPADPADPADSARPDGTPSRPHVVVAVVGSAARGIPEQVQLIADLGLPVLRLDPRLLLESPERAAAQVAARMTARGLVLALDQGQVVDTLSARQLTAALAAAAAPATTRATVLLTTGGETARAVLDLLGVGTLTPDSTRAAAVTSHTPDGLVVITRPGSHGASASSLRDALAPFVPAPHSDPTNLH
jgi:uncharacterized protein YgbK (DUF1537 family)